MGESHFAILANAFPPSGSPMLLCGCRGANGLSGFPVWQCRFPLVPLLALRPSGLLCAHVLQHPLRSTCSEGTAARWLLAFAACGRLNYPQHLRGALLKRCSFWFLSPTTDWVALGQCLCFLTMITWIFVLQLQTGLLFRCGLSLALLRVDCDVSPCFNSVV